MLAHANRIVNLTIVVGVVGFCIQALIKSEHACKSDCKFTIVVVGVVGFCIQIIISEHACNKYCKFTSLLLRFVCK